MKKIFILFLVLSILSACTNLQVSSSDSQYINNLKYDYVDYLDDDIHSSGYLLIRLSDFEVLYALNTSERRYPASLTKIATMATVLNYVDDLDDRSSVTYDQVVGLINENASLAYIQRDHEYTIKDLLYALILPSGADAALALENYFTAQNQNLVDLMNKHMKKIGCKDTHFVNTTGLHDDDHYTTIDDLYKIILDVLQHEEGRKILESLHYELEDGITVNSSLAYVSSSNVEVLGGKTGFTDEAGQSLVVFYRKNGRSYMLMLLNAMGNPYEKKYFHFEDALDIFYTLYD